MNLTLWQLTLRRWAELATSRRLYVLFAMFIIVGTVLGPYGSFNQAPLFERLGISLILNLACWTVGIGIIPPMRLYLEQRQVEPLIALIVSGLAASSLIIPLLSVLLNNLTGVTLNTSQYIEHGVLFSALVILITRAMLPRDRKSKDEPVGESNRVLAQPDTEAIEVARYQLVRTPHDPHRCPLQQKLPEDKRGVLYAMIAQDHYVEFVTSKGSELVLMRLSDAAGEANPNYGLRIHRSAWISIFGISRLERRGRQTFVILKNGQELPVSRSRQRALRTLCDNASQLPDVVASKMELDALKV